MPAEMSLNAKLFEKKNTFFEKVSLNGSKIEFEDIFHDIVEIITGMQYSPVYIL